MKRKKNSSTNNEQRKYSRQSGVLWLVSMAIIPVMIAMPVGCDVSDFGDMNTNPTVMLPEVMDDALLFPNLLVSVAGNREEHWRANLIYSSSIIQHVAHPWYAGESYAQNIPWAIWFWESAYSGGGVNWRAQVKNAVDLLAILEDQQEEGRRVDNKIAMTRILRAFIFHRITDLYGDAPYSEAGKGFLEQNFTPRFDRQEDIYTDMLNELAEAVLQFDASQTLTYSSEDFLYGGDIARWQRFANSLRLRLAMRLVNVDAAKARMEAEAAVNAPGGLMQSLEDIAVHPHESGPGATCCNPHGNPIAFVYDADPDIFLSQTLVNWMLAHNDPRLSIYGAVYQGGQEITDPALQMGRPNGYTGSLLEDHASWAIAESRDPDTPATSYTKLHRRWLDVTNPQVYLTHAETEFLLAEMAVRGWNAPADAATHYNNGVRAAMEYLTVYVGNTNIPEAEVNAYLAANPFDGSPEQIHTQYWAAVFMNGYEAWANWRRTGYPVLEPTLVDGGGPHPASATSGQFPRRLLYSPDDAVLNATNYQEAIDRQGPDNLLTRIWWDVE